MAGDTADRNYATSLMFVVC